MKALGLLRHAKSDWGPSDRRDFDRGVNDRGRRGARLIGEHIRSLECRWELVLASPAERVRITLAEALPDPAPVWDRQLYLAPAETICDVLREKGGEASSVLVAGHNPGLADMILELVAPAMRTALFDEAKLKFPTAGFAILELAIDDWADIAPGCGALAHFKRPRDLDPGLGPLPG